MSLKAPNFLTIPKEIGKILAISQIILELF